MTRWMPSAPVMLAALALLAAFPSSVLAQPSWYVVMSASTNCGPPGTSCPLATQLYRATVSGGQVSLNWRREVPVSRPLGEAYVTPDGGLVVWLGATPLGPFVYVHDAATGSTLPIGPLHGAKAMIGNPARAELYLFDNSGVTTVSPSLVRRTELDCSADSINSPTFAISRDGMRMSEICFRGGVRGTLVVDTGSGAPMRFVPRPGTISADDAEIVVGGLQPTSVVQRIDVATGALLAEVPAAALRLVVDPLSGDVLTSWPPYAPSSLRDRQTLVEKASLFVDGGRAQFSPAAPLLATYDSASLQLTDTALPGLLMRAATPFDAGIAMAFGPPPPAAASALTATVTGNAVVLAWQPGGPPAAITRYVLEVGSAPGLSNIFTGLDVGLQTSFAASGVPPGTYYVRVRAGNYTGVSAPSNEVVVQVP